jgi:hypothetical protein
MSDPRFFRKYIDILKEAEIPAPTQPVAPTQPTAPTAPAAPTPPTPPQSKTTTAPTQPGASAQGAQPAQKLPKLVTPTAEQLKATYKDLSAFGNGITSQGRSPEEQAQDKAKWDQAIARYTASIEALRQQGKAAAADLKQKQVDRLKAQAEKESDPEYFGKHDPDAIGTIAQSYPFARLVDAVRGQTGPAYTGKDVDMSDAPAESGWVSIAKALTYPAGQALFLNGDVAPSLLYKLNPWATDAGLAHQVLDTLPNINDIRKGNIG